MKRRVFWFSAPVNSAAPRAGTWTFHGTPSPCAGLATVGMCNARNVHILWFHAADLIISGIRRGELNELDGEGRKRTCEFVLIELTWQRLDAGIVAWYLEEEEEETLWGQ